MKGANGAYGNFSAQAHNQQLLEDDEEPAGPSGREDPGGRCGELGGCRVCVGLIGIWATVRFLFDSAIGGEQAIWARLTDENAARVGLILWQAWGFIQACHRVGAMGRPWG